MIIPSALARVAKVLDRTGIAYMITGSFASAYYGAPRSTQDIDIVIEASAQQLQTFGNSLPSDEYYLDVHAAVEAEKRQSMFNVIDLSTGWKIDLIIRKARAFSEEEFRRRQLIIVEGLSLFVATAEDLIVAKLEWSKLSQSRRQIEDVVGILRVRRDSLDHRYLEKWIRELALETEWSAAREGLE